MFKGGESVYPKIFNFFLQSVVKHGKHFIPNTGKNIARLLRKLHIYVLF